MANALALLVGLKEVGWAARNGWDGGRFTSGAERDLDCLQDMFWDLRYQVKSLRTKQATAEAVLDALHEAARRLQSGDILAFHFIGHGGEPEARLAAYDRAISDDEMDDAWSRFRAGVRIVAIADGAGPAKPGIETCGQVNPVSEQAAGAMKAMMLYLGGCRMDARTLTDGLCETWHSGEFHGLSYRALYAALCDRLKGVQEPTYTECGPMAGEFPQQKAFMVEWIENLGIPHVSESERGSIDQVLGESPQHDSEISSVRYGWRSGG